MFVTNNVFIPIAIYTTDLVGICTATTHVNDYGPVTYSENNYGLVTYSANMTIDMTLTQQQ